MLVIFLVRLCRVRVVMVVLFGKGWIVFVLVGDFVVYGCCFVFYIIGFGGLFGWCLYVMC